LNHRRKISNQPHQFLSRADCRENVLKIERLKPLNNAQSRSSKSYRNITSATKTDHFGGYIFIC